MLDAAVGWLQVTWRRAPGTRWSVVQPITSPGFLVSTCRRRSSGDAVDVEDGSFALFNVRSVQRHGESRLRCFEHLTPGTLLRPLPAGGP